MRATQAARAATTGASMAIPAEKCHPRRAPTPRERRAMAILASLLDPANADATRATLARLGCAGAARAWGIDRRTVARRVVPVLGVEVRRGRIRAVRFDESAARAMRAAGASWEAIGKALGASRMTARRRAGDVAAPSRLARTIMGIVRIVDLAPSDVRAALSGARAPTQIEARLLAPWLALPPEVRAGIRGINKGRKPTGEV